MIIIYRIEKFFRFTIIKFFPKMTFEFANSRQIKLIEIIIL